MKNNPQTITCLSITDKAIKFVQSKGGAISALQAITLTHRTDDEISRGLDVLFKDKRQKDVGKFILSLPRQVAALHYVRLPSHKPDEIREMARLQASKQLPYEPQAIVLGYQIIRLTPEGYSDVLLAIVHQDIIKKYLRLLERNTLEPTEITIDTQGIPRWLKLQSLPAAGSACVIVELDIGYVRLDIVASGVAIYSRAFSLNVPVGEYRPRLAEEISKSLAAYEKETIGIKPENILITGAEELVSAIGDNLHLPLKYSQCPQSQGVNLKPDPAIRSLDFQKNSFASLLGMVLSGDALPFNLLPEGTLLKRQKKIYAQQMYTLIVFSCLFIGTIGIGMFLSFFEREKTRLELNQQLHSLSEDIDRIERMSKKLNYVKEQLEYSNICLDALTEVFRIAANDIHLVFFGYDSEKPVVLKGQAKTLAEIFNFVNTLEASEMFREVQVKHSSKRKIKDEEVADFEIVCPLESR